MHRLAAGALLVAMAVGSLGSPRFAAAWANNGDKIGTHDWILAQALRVLGGAPDWMNVQVALQATDDPDLVERVQSPVTVAWHVYKEKGRRGGAPSAVLMRYGQAVDAIATGDQRSADGDAAGARAAYDEASRLVGLLAHYEGDVAQPFHTAYAAMDDDTLHSRYELLVESLTRSATAQPQWQSPAHPVTASTDIRRTVVRTAAYSRGFYPELRKHLVAHPGTLDARASEITGLVLRRATDDLASIIAAIGTRGGYGPEVRVSVSTREHWIAAGSTELLSIRATDPSGRPIEGVLFTATIPKPDGTIRRETWATDPNGNAHFSFPVRGFARSAKITVPLSTTIGSTVISRPQWFMVTPTLGRFRVGASPTKAVVGQAVRARAVARDRSGRGVRGLTVTFAWNDGWVVVKTTAVTDKDGVAIAWRTFATPSDVTVVARTRSGSAGYKAAVSLQVR